MNFILQSDVRGRLKTAWLACNRTGTSRKFHFVESAPELVVFGGKTQRPILYMQLQNSVSSLSLRMDLQQIITSIRADNGDTTFLESSILDPKPG